MVATTNSAATMPTYTILKKTVVPRALTSRASAGFHVRLVFRLCSTLKRLLIHRGTMAWLLKSHNGVHCCGTVGDSHSHSQLSTATCTSQGGLLCFRSALQRYNNIPTPPNFFEKKSVQFALALFPARSRPSRAANSKIPSLQL